MAVGTLTIDVGLSNTCVGVVKAGVLSVALDAVSVDVTNAIAPHDVQAGAGALTRAVPLGEVSLAVVAPRVGGALNGVAVGPRSSLFVEPDNDLKGLS
jgi:S-adenosyl-L-methionine hydrolase (adenosine-forming)